MRAMHGEVRVDTSPAGGARLVVALPVLASDGDEPGADGEGESGGVRRSDDVGDGVGVGEGVGEGMLE
jgi:hypothetical protein